MKQIEQKVINLVPNDGMYHNFFFTPGSIGSLAKHVNVGWLVKEIIKLGEDTACVILEREKMGGE